MKEIQDILRAHDAARAANRACALATVVRVSGSTYRRPGARMLITADGEVTGCVSGGCLEREVVNQARRVLASGEPRVVTFDSAAEEDVVFGFGQGCNGVIEVLIERLNDNADQLLFFADCIKNRRDAVQATVFAIQGEGARVGDLLMMQEGGATIANIADESLRTAVATDAKGVLNGRSQTVVYEFPNGRAHVFIERILPPLALVLFGAGHDVVPLVRLANGLGWHVTLVDHRSDDVARARRLGANVVIVARPEEFGEKVKWDPRGAVVVMNHNYLDDLDVLERVLQAPPRYVGVLGPRARTERMLADLRKRNVSLTRETVGRLYAPVGLDIGADHPEEIALSIVAEIQAVMSNRSGEPLRDKSGPLHARLVETHAGLKDPQSKRDALPGHLATGIRQ